MKNILFKDILKAVCWFAAVAFPLPSCTKSDIALNTTPLPTAISFIQASPNEPPVNLYLNGVKFASSTFNYGQSAGYLAINSGVYSVAFTSDIDGKVLLTDSINFKAETNYSLFLANKPGQPEVVLLTDTLNQPAAGNASIRFINLSPDAPAVDLVEKGGPVLVSNRAYKGFSSFSPLAGNQFYTFEVHRAGTSTVLATLNNLKLESAPKSQNSKI
jgi:hypothetical protein